MVIDDVHLSAEQLAQLLSERHQRPDARLIPEVDEKIKIGLVGVGSLRNRADHPGVSSAGPFDRGPDLVSETVENQGRTNRGSTQ